jgi:hypothetical protein
VPQKGPEQDRRGVSTAQHQTLGVYGADPRHPHRPCYGQLSELSSLWVPLGAHTELSQHYTQNF